MYAGLSPYEALAIYAVISLHGLRCGSVVPAGRHARGAAGDGRRGGEARRRAPLRHDGRRGSSGAAAARSACTTADGERVAGRRGRADPGPAGRLPRAARAQPRRAAAAATRRRAGCCWPGRDGATPARRTTRSTSARPGGDVRGDPRRPAAERPVAAGQHPDDRPTRRWRRTAGRSTTCCSRRRTSTRRSTGRESGRLPGARAARRSRRAATPASATGIEVEHVTTPLDWAARGHGARHAVRGGAHVRPDRAVPAAQPVGARTSSSPGRARMPGVGVPMVLICGRLAAERILGPDPSYRSRAWL